MIPRSLILGAFAATISTVLYNPIHDFVYITFGVGREMQPLSDFAYKCRNVYGPPTNSGAHLLESCEDLWLDEKGRTLFAACVDVVSRRSWNAGGDHFQPSGRTPNGRIVALSIDSPGPSGNYHARSIPIIGFPGPSRTIDPVGFVASTLSDGQLRFWVANLPPRVEGAEWVAVGNGSVEVFDLEEERLRWVGSFGGEGEKSGKVAHSPNNVAVDGKGGFVVSNDHSAPSGLRRHFDLFLGGGSLAHCTDANTCRTLVTGLSFPNGLVRGADGLFYVPSSLTGLIEVYELSSGTLTKVDEIVIGMPLDNLSVDGVGDIWAVAFPKGLDLIKEVKTQRGAQVPTTVWRIRRGEKEQSRGGRRGEYQVVKVLEDKEGTTLPTGSTVAVHDARSGRIFLGTVVEDHITVCEPVLSDSE